MSQSLSFEFYLNDTWRNSTIIYDSSLTMRVRRTMTLEGSSSHQILTPGENRAFVLKALLEWPEAAWSLIGFWSKRRKIRKSAKVGEHFLGQPTHRSTMTAGICTSCTGLFPSFSAWVRFSICPRITDICFSNSPRSKPLSCLNSSRRSLHISSTKFWSDSRGKTRSLISWLNGAFACGSHAQW